MKANPFRWYPVDPALGHGDSVEDGKATLLHPFPESALLQQYNDLCMIPSMGMIMNVGVLMVMPVFLMMSIGRSMMVLLMMVMASIRSLVPVMPLDQKTPTGDPTSLSSLKAASRQFHRHGRKSCLEHFFGHPEVA
jgi:hypothetical protein